MQVSTFCSDLITWKDLSSLKTLMNSKPLNFVERALQLGLCPKTDFRYSDLVGCDFTNCDIRGFDFTGADLSYAFGLGVVWDGTTVTSSAQLDGSFLAAEADLERQRDSNPQWEVEYQRISREDDALSLDYVKDMFRNSPNEERSKAFFMLKRMYFGAKNLVVRNNMLYCASAYAKDAAETRDFLKYLIASPQTSEVSFRSAVRVLSEAFYDDKFTNAILVACLGSSDDQVRLAALKGLIKGPDFPENTALLCHRLAYDRSIEVRRALLKAVCARQQVLIFVSRNGDVIDYLEPQDYNKMLDIAVAAATSIVRTRLRKEGMRDYFLVKPTNTEIHQALRMVNNTLGVLRKIGFPIVTARLNFREFVLPKGDRHVQVLR